MSVNSSLKVNQIISQRKAFIGKGFQSLAVRGKKLFTYTSCNIQEWRQKKYPIYQNNEQTYLENKEVEPVQRVQMNIYQSNTYRYQKSCISVFVAYPTIPSSNQEHQPRHDNNVPCMSTWQIYQSNLRRKKLDRTNQDPYFLGSSLSNRDNVRARIQFRRESQPQIRFHSNSTCVIRPVDRNQLSFSSNEINQPLSALVHRISQIRFKF